MESRLLAGDVDDPLRLVFIGAACLALIATSNFIEKSAIVIYMGLAALGIWQVFLYAELIAAIFTTIVFGFVLAYLADRSCALTEWSIVSGFASTTAFLVYINLAWVHVRYIDNIDKNTAIEISSVAGAVVLLHVILVWWHVYPRGIQYIEMSTG